MFKPWPKEKADLIILANILNRNYFSDDEIISVINNLISYANDGALFAIIDNRQNTDEKSSIFALGNNKLLLRQKINEGTEIEGLILQNQN